MTEDQKIENKMLEWKKELEHIFFRSDYAAQLYWVDRYAEYSRYTNIHVCAGEDSTDVEQVWDEYIYPVMSDLASRLDSSSSFCVRATHDGILFFPPGDVGMQHIVVDDIDMRYKRVEICYDSVCCYLGTLESD